MKPLIAAIVITMIATGASAQVQLPAALPQSGSAQTSTLHSTDENANTMSFNEVLALSKAADRSFIAEAIPEAAKKMVAEQGAGATDLLRSGRVLDLTESAGAAVNPLQQRSVNVRVSYDARPVGGILN